MNEKESDNELMKQFSNCSMLAYNQIYHRYKNKLLNHLVFSGLITRNYAEDIVQKTMLQVYKYKFKYKDKFQFSTWVYTIAKNYCLNESKQANNTIGLDDLLFHEKGNIENSFLSYADNSIDVADSEIKIKFIRMQMLKVKDKYREVLTLRYIDNMSLEEIAGFTHKNLNTVKSLLKRGLELLKEYSKQYTYEN